MPEVIYFYTKTGPYFELSNFSPHGIEIDGRYWPTVEHFYQAQKFLDEAYRERIRRAPSPRLARELGRSRSQPIRVDWDARRVEVMTTALRRKFEHPELREILLSTAPQPLVEASPFDHFWGCGQDGSGENRLGRLLEQIRDELSTER